MGEHNDGPRQALVEQANTLEAAIEASEATGGDVTEQQEQLAAIGERLARLATVEHPAGTMP